jgi:3D-(3,5/4)-trihydroxycyclohexane-1,2-dione acylhydrolase (decyclizing)
VIYVPVDSEKGVPGYESWWDVPVAEVSEQPDVQRARKEWERGKKNQRYY